MEELSGQLQDGQEAMGTLWGPASAHSQVSSPAEHGAGLPPSRDQLPPPRSPPAWRPLPLALFILQASARALLGGRPFLLTAAVSLILSAICNCPFVYCLFQIRLFFLLYKKILAVWLVRS